MIKTAIKTIKFTLISFLVSFVAWTILIIVDHSFYSFPSIKPQKFIWNSHEGQADLQRLADVIATLDEDSIKDPAKIQAAMETETHRFHYLFVEPFFDHPRPGVEYFDDKVWIRSTHQKYGPFAEMKANGSYVALNLLGRFKDSCSNFMEPFFFKQPFKAQLVVDDFVINIEPMTEMSSLEEEDNVIKLSMKCLLGDHKPNTVQIRLFVK